MLILEEKTDGTYLHIRGGKIFNVSNGIHPLLSPFFDWGGRNDEKVAVGKFNETRPAPNLGAIEAQEWTTHRPDVSGNHFSID